MGLRVDPPLVCCLVEEDVLFGILCCVVGFEAYQAITSSRRRRLDTLGAEGPGIGKGLEVAFSNRA